MNTTVDSTLLIICKIIGETSYNIYKLASTVELTP